MMKSHNMLHKIKQLAVFCSIVLLITGCALVFQGEIEEVTFMSQPENAKVIINGMNRGATPLTLNLQTDKEYHLQFELNGIVSQTYVIEGSIGAGWVILDVLLGVVPVIIDAATGAWYSFDNTTYKYVFDNAHNQKTNDNLEWLIWNEEFIKAAY